MSSIIDFSRSITSQCEQISLFFKNDLESKNNQLESKILRLVKSLPKDLKKITTTYPEASEKISANHIAILKKNLYKFYRSYSRGSAPDNEQMQETIGRIEFRMGQICQGLASLASLVTIAPTFLQALEMRLRAINSQLRTQEQDKPLRTLVDRENISMRIKAIQQSIDSQLSLNYSDECLKKLQTFKEQSEQFLSTTLSLLDEDRLTADSLELSYHTLLQAFEALKGRIDTQAQKAPLPAEELSLEEKFAVLQHPFVRKEMSKFFEFDLSKLQSRFPNTLNRVSCLLSSFYEARYANTLINEVIENGHLLNKNTFLLFLLVDAARNDADPFASEIFEPFAQQVVDTTGPFANKTCKQLLDHHMVGIKEVTDTKLLQHITEQVPLISEEGDKPLMTFIGKVYNALNKSDFGLFTTFLRLGLYPSDTELCAAAQNLLFALPDMSQKLLNMLSEPRERKTEI